MADVMTKIDSEVNDVLEKLSLNIDDTSFETIEKYLDLLFMWHENNNILSTRSRSYFLQRDFYDSLSMLRHIPKGPLLDIGTGGGIPGMLLSFFISNNTILLDRRQNAIRFLEHAKLKLDLNNVKIIKSDIKEMNINDQISSVLIKNFSNKIVSKLNFDEKIEYLINIIRSRLNKNIPIFMLTGSTALEADNFSYETKKKLRSSFSTLKIETPYFDTNRYLLEIKHV